MRWLMCAAIAAIACGDKGQKEPDKNDMPSNQVNRPDNPTPGRWLLLQRVDDNATEAHYAAAAIDGGGVDVKPEVVVAAATSRFGARAPAARAGESWYAAVKTGERWSLHVRELARPDKPPVNIPLEVAEVTALLAVDQRVVIGAGHIVGYLDTSAGDLTLVKLAERQAGIKAYDVLARDGDLIAAIDDVVMPIYGDLLAIGPDRISHVAGWEMPAFINGTYGAAVLHKTGARDATIYAIGAYGIMSGNGQDLIALPIRGGKLEANGMSVVNSGGAGATDPPVIEEHVARGSNKVEKIAAGTEMTHWTGIAQTADRSQIALAAGKRGVLLVPASFGPATRAQMVDVGGECTDVIVEGGVLYALVASGGAGKLVIVDGARVGKTIELPAVYQRFVR